MNELHRNDKALRYLETLSKRELIKFCIFSASNARLEDWARKYDEQQEAQE